MNDDAFENRKEEFIDLITENRTVTELKRLKHNFSQIQLELDRQAMQRREHLARVGPQAYQSTKDAVENEIKFDQAAFDSAYVAINGGANLSTIKEMKFSAARAAGGVRGYRIISSLESFGKGLFIMVVLMAIGAFITGVLFPYVVTNYFPAPVVAYFIRYRENKYSTLVLYGFGAVVAGMSYLNFVFQEFEKKNASNAKRKGQ